MTGAEPVATPPPRASHGWSRALDEDRAGGDAVPMTYAWIAFGSALGGVGRYWLALAMVRATGPEFPWGTILINILGSLLIGFFGALTASGGRLVVPPDIRVFVMVGICGGFTTFSSFSLQTLDLLRDGRVAQALGNIGLSVLLCLVAVAAGHYAATALNLAQAAGQEG